MPLILSVITPDNVQKSLELSLVRDLSTILGCTLIPILLLRNCQMTK